MLLEPWKSPEEIDRRLAALTDPELAELLRRANRENYEDEAESYSPPSAPYWKKRIALLALAGLMAMSAGYGFVSTSHEHPQTASKPLAAPVIPQHRQTRAAHHPRTAAPPVAKRHAAPPVAQRHAAPPAHAAVAAAPAAPSELQIRRARAQMLHEQALAAQAEAQARAQAAQAHHQAQLAVQAQAQANAQSLQEALAQARAQARAEALAQARAEAVANAQARELEAAQQQALLENASNSGVKPGAVEPPSTTIHIGTTPSDSGPAPMPGPAGPNCTPHRGALFSSVLDHVRVGGTNAGYLLRLVHGP